MSSGFICRSVFASASGRPEEETEERALLLKEKIWHVLTVFWDRVHD